MIVLDASVLIAHLESGDPHHERATALLLSRALEPFAASPLTIAEVLVGPARTHRIEAARVALAALGISTVDLDADSPARLALLRAATGLKLPDCCVLHAAEQSGSSIATFDGPMAAAARSLDIPVPEQ